MSGKYHSPMHMGWPGDFCRKCGARLVVEVRETGSFDDHYGTPDRQESKTCPNRRHWWDGHTKSGWADQVYIPDPPERVQAR